MIVVPDQDGIIARWVAARIPGMQRGFGECTAIGIVDGEQLVAGMVYHNWHPETGVIEFSGAATTPRWLTPRTLHEMFAYPFDEIGVQLLFTRNSEKNVRLHRMLKSYGFDLHRIPRGRGRDEAEMFWTLTDDQWRANSFERFRAEQPEEAAHG